MDIGVDPGAIFARTPTLPYQEVYRGLAMTGLQVIGVEFITHVSQLQGLAPPDFETFIPEVGFPAMQGQHAWSDVKNILHQRTPEILDISARFKTYHRLLTLRIGDLSDAYRRCLFGQVFDLKGRRQHPPDRQLFSNGFQPRLEAAVHAWLADAAGLRDLIAEAVWRLVLKDPKPGPKKLAPFLTATKTRTEEHPLVAELQTAGAAGGWLKVLSDLRNDVLHTAPLANSQELDSMQMRALPLTGSGGSIPFAHYPLTLADGSLRPRPPPVDFDDEATLRSRLEAYRDFIDASGDALNYAVRTTERLIGLATRVREAAGLAHKIRSITDADIIGPVQIG
jgi:hypothetical protein